MGETVTPLLSGEPEWLAQAALPLSGARGNVLRAGWIVSQREFVTNRLIDVNDKPYPLLGLD